MRCLARSPDDRFASAAELRAALQAADLGAPEPVSYADNTAITTRTPPAGTPVAAGGAAAAAGKTAGAGAAAGTATPAPTEGGGAAFVRRERSFLLPALIVILVAGALAVAGVLIGNTLADRGIIGGSDTPGTTAAPASTAGPLAVTAAIPFDPEGDGAENDDAAPRVLDDDPGTEWVTETYSAPATQFGGLKDGLGLALTLDQAAALGELSVTFSTPGWTADVYVAAEPAAELAGWGEPVATGQAFGEGDTTVDLGGATGGAVLIWITALPDTGNVAIGSVAVTADSP